MEARQHLRCCNESWDPALGSAATQDSEHQEGKGAAEFK